MDELNVVQFFQDKTIFVAGATGFLAKILVEKILRIQPNVKKIFLLIRTNGGKPATERMHDEIIGTKLFTVLRRSLGANFSSFISEKVISVSGDISFDNFAIKDSNLKEELWRDIDIIVNSAATTTFDERYDIAMGINTIGAMHVLNFAKKCAKLQLLLHVSTAYVCGVREGLILEKPMKMGEAVNGGLGLDIDVENKLVEKTLNDLHSKQATQEAITTAFKDLGLQRAMKYGWANTYTFTKAMGEMVLEHLKENLPIVIIRPTVITSTIKEPFPGWIEGLRTADIVAVSYSKGKLKFFIGDDNLIIDTIPGDMVVNLMVVAMVAHSNIPNCHRIYHVGSSLRNPLKSGNLGNSFYNYFSKNPWIDINGTPVKVVKLALLSMDRFRMYMAIRYLIPLKALQVVNIICCRYFEGIYVNLNRKNELVMRLAKLYEPFLFFKGIFDDINTEKLRVVARENGVEEDMFYFDPKSVHWEDYFTTIHLPGVLKYVVK